MSEPLTTIHRDGLVVTITVTFPDESYADLMMAMVNKAIASHGGKRIRIPFQNVRPA